MEPRINFYTSKVAGYLKAILLVLLMVMETVIILLTSLKYVNTEQFYYVIIVVICCALLAVSEGISSFLLKKFLPKMSLFVVDAALLCVIGICAGNSLLAALYCVVLTQVYVNEDKFYDRLPVMLVSCLLFVASFVTGWVLNNPGESFTNSTVQIMTGALFGLLAIVIDFIMVQFLITFYQTNKRLSVALKEVESNRAKLEEAYRQLSETAVYEERNRIARDIHDNAGHSMTTVIMQTEAAKLLIDSDPAEAKDRIISANMQAKNALEQIRDCVHLLAGKVVTRPIKEELENIILQSMDGTNIKIRYSVADVSVTDDNYRFVCNALTECISNGIRHGGATAFFVELRAAGNCLELCVSDNGNGAKGTIKAGFGLSGIINKTKSLGGECRFSAPEGEGFEVNIKIPVIKEEKSDD